MSNPFHSVLVAIEEKILGSKIRDLAAQAAASKNSWVQKSWDFVMRNKAVLSSAFVIAWGWAKYNGCPPLLGENVLTLIHFGTWHPTCADVTTILGGLGFAGIAAGVFPSDIRAAKVQGKA